MPDHTLRNSLVVAAMTAAGATVCAVVGWAVFEFDRALFVYAQTLIVSLALTVYRFAIWTHRPPTRMVYRQAWRNWMTSPNRRVLVQRLVGRSLTYFGANSFVWKRGWNRWSAHWPVMLGCVMAMAIVMPLIFGWVWFETPPGDFTSYTVMVFGLAVRTIPVDGIEAFLAFHGLVWAAFPVTIGVCIAFWRRLNDRGDKAVQTFGNDLLPLALLLAIAVTGLMLTVSYSFLGGWMHAPLAKTHMVIVCGTLLWLPYSKLFHIPQRSLKFAHMVCEHEAAALGKQSCARCGNDFADKQQVDNLIAVQKELGYRYETEHVADHYQQICPRCRRASLVLAHGARWRSVGSTAVSPLSEPLTV